MVKDGGMTKGKTGSPERDLRFGGSSVALGSALNGQRSTLGHLAALPDTQNPYNKYTNGDADKDSIDDGIHMGNYCSFPPAYAGIFYIFILIAMDHLLFDLFLKTMFVEQHPSMNNILSRTDA